MMKHYKPSRTGICVVISFFLLGILEEWSFLPLLSLRRLITEVSGGFGVILIIIIYLCTASCRVYPPISSTVSLLLFYRDNLGLMPKCKRHGTQSEVQSNKLTKQSYLPGSCRSEYFCRTWITSAPYFSSLSSVTPSICRRTSGSEESFSVREKK